MSTTPHPADPVRCVHPGCRVLGTYRRTADGARICHGHATAQPWKRSTGTVRDPMGMDRAAVEAFLAEPDPRGGDR